MALYKRVGFLPLNFAGEKPPQIKAVIIKKSKKARGTIQIDIGRRASIRAKV
jgi:hypothetical protein